MGCADADEDVADNYADADATTHVGAHPRPLDVITPFLGLVLVVTFVILNPAWATVSLTTGMIWAGNCHSSSL